MAGIKPEKYQDYVQGKISYEEATGNGPASTTAPAKATQPTAPTNSNSGYGNGIEKPATMQPGYGGAIAEIIPQGGVISNPTNYAAAARPTIDIGGITSGVQADIKNQIDKQVLAANQGLGQMTQANNLAVTENQNYLNDQIAKMTKQKANDMDNAVSFQNRRGGFYSGGVDYQQGQINNSYGEAQGTLTRDIAARNQDIWNRNALLAQQTAEKITQLQQQAPDLIRQRIDELVNKQLADRNAQAAQTGYMADGTPTAQMQQYLDQKKAANDKAIEVDKKARIDYAQNLQKTFGVPIVVKNDYGLMDEQVKGLIPTSEKDKQIKNAIDVSDKLGYVTAELSQATGIPVGTPMLEAQKMLESNKIGWYNAQTSRQNANTSANNSSVTNSRYSDQKNAKGFEGDVMDELGQLDPSDYEGWLTQNRGEIVRQIGTDGYDRIRKSVTAPSQQESKAADSLRTQATNLAKNDPGWYDEASREALIQQYMSYLR
ncbi:hypothetical protein LOZ80_38110 [Paenibacillus sp. HWE-109]|uniref:hypothetical protein n=1 Tax=Paenibacillus sp. HWE-109 TaxID=1306526 RepID=UPI001EDFD850|nr:hypothetical protein [Paenibacillus sp. HWE-109]UKS27208.1 hypothetical protein LOZ80_38110 [Paenibacillus sp. HWE-109]